MSDIRQSAGICTQINVVKLPADNQDEVVKLMIERARFIAKQPGFVSVNLTAARTAAMSSITCSGPAPTSLPPRIMRLSSARNGRNSANW